MKRVFLIVLDSVGIGEMKDAADFGDVGSHTVYAASADEAFYMPNMAKMGFFEMDGAKVAEKNTWLSKIRALPPEEKKIAGIPCGAFARMAERSKGKDTTIGHWEIAGVVSKSPLPTFPEGFPEEFIHEFEEKTGRKTLCNRPYSGTEVIRDYGKEHMETGALIVYTSADSVFQIAAHEEKVPVEELYRYCEIARELLKGEKLGAGRVIARPFEGEWPYKRTTRRHDYSLVPPRKTMLDYLLEQKKDVLAVGKINDIFAGQGIGEMVRTTGNTDGIKKTLEYMDRDFEGLCFVNLVDFDMLYGHRNDISGYARALNEFDAKLPELMAKLREDDLLMITADHGCDPSTAGTDHSREYTPLLILGRKVKEAVNLGTREGFCDIAATILDYFSVSGEIEGNSLLGEILNKEIPSSHISMPILPEEDDGKIISKWKMDEYETIQIPVSDGTEREFAILKTFSVEGKNYVAVSLVEKDEIKEGVYIYRYSDAEDGDMIVEQITLPAEYKKVVRAYEAME